MDKRILVVLAATLCVNQLQASDVTIPNVFVDGTTASAPKVNQNFSAIENAVDDNNLRIDTNSTDIQTNKADIQTNTADISSNTSDIQAISLGSASVVVDSNAQVLGTFLSFGRIEVIYGMDINRYILQTSTNYIAESTSSTGITNLIFVYGEATCSGNPEYVAISNDTYVPHQGFIVQDSSSAKGQVSQCPEYSSLCYIPFNAATTDMMLFYKQGTAATCVEYNSTPVPAYKPLVNDPNVTGIGLSTIQPPLLIRRP